VLFRYFFILFFYCNVAASVLLATDPEARVRFPALPGKKVVGLELSPLSVCSRTKENHGKPWSSWSVAGPSGCRLTPSQQSSIEFANPNVSPYR
jgi:hypothetical protein